MPTYRSTLDPEPSTYVVARSRSAPEYGGRQEPATSRGPCQDPCPAGIATLDSTGARLASARALATARYQGVPTIRRMQAAAMPVTRRGGGALPVTASEGTEP